MNAVQILTIAVLSCLYLAVHVCGDCYIQYGCKDATRKKFYQPGSVWIPKSNTCYSCQCYSVKKYTLVCQKAVDIMAEQKLNVRKSSLYATFSADDGSYEDEEIEITRAEAVSKRCDPVAAPTFNWETMTFEEVAYKNVYYYYNRKEMQCCSRFPQYRSVHPSCKVVKIGKCKGKVVMRKNPKKMCTMSMSMVG